MPVPPTEESSRKNPDLLSSPTTRTTQQSNSDSDSRDPSTTPVFTPSSPSPSGSPRQTENIQDEILLHTMSDQVASSSGKTDAAQTKQDVDGSPETNAKTELKLSPAPPDSAPKKTSCKKHTSVKANAQKKQKDKKKSKKAKDSSSSDSDDSSSSSSSSSCSDSSDSDSESSDSDSHKKKKKRAKEKEKKKAKSRKQAPSDDDESESTEEESEPDDKHTKKQKKAKTKKKPKKSRKTQEDESEEESDVESLEEQLRATQQKLAALRLKQSSQRTQLKSKSKKRKRASKVAFKRVDELWDDTIHNYKLTETVDDPDANEWDQYIFTVRRKFDWENKYTDTVVDIKSKPLRDALAHVMDGVKGVSLVQETPVVDPNMLFLYLEESREYVKELKALAKSEKKKKAKRLAATKSAHLKVLVKYLDNDYAETKKTLYPLLESNMITFDLLWAIFKPNTNAYTPTYSNPDEPRAFKIEYASKESSFMKGQWYEIEGRYLEYDGKSFGMGTMSVEVESFKGSRKISSLACYPLKYHRDPEGLKAKLVERGKKFVALQGVNYRFHKGMAFYKKKRSIIKVNINGRVMVDPAIHRRINPNYPISTVKPKDPDLVDESEYESGSDDCCCCTGSGSESEHGSKDDSPKMRLKLVKDKDGSPHIVQVECDEDGEEIVNEDLDKIAGKDQAGEKFEFSDEELLIASPVVLGFAFSEKLWLEFTVSGMNEIEWNSGAFDSLVLPDNQKSIVKALVESHTFHAAENIDDVIQGKGKGLVAVLHGPPGTGKTLTAEGIAELLKRPLYMVSAGELGTDSRTLEGELNKILDIAHSWGAVLLLDEADVFLEKRTIHDIHRNALVSIFLRLLEYFQGILFLTTNRVETFDDAFQSRIHVALRYGDLTQKAKRTVWKMFLDKVRVKEGVEVVPFTEADYDSLSRRNLNGRQIKNSVRTAQALALNEKTPLSMEHIARVLDVAETFDQDLKGGTGYIDAMRSYT
ncbi:conserved hypothetical protein [Histoplasma capsulatum G186AR]|uniref:AAA+ ATPase domain-containing protein n=2 Tax=Ajellomyces capsulatus TaxID=5037 RepID=C0NDG7_AJECG|nr:uncharacterized protein HCBG_01163 [Histoplasma capsulatum G186AR]EEH11708.1 conserved hypothetical protein [Histoplasma capsulatum G186AR]KAG5302439.1 AAA family ATPase [Histoplasma capsulatum]QSS72162.1 AAA family ATPase [Histoplasma capsulatum G186AR]